MCITFSVDYLLPVQVDGNWVGVVYRDGQCIMTLMDHYDITNKAIQCDPSFDIQSMDWFTNDFNRLEITPDVLSEPSKVRKSMNRACTLKSESAVRPPTHHSISPVIVPQPLLLIPLPIPMTRVSAVYCQERLCPGASCEVTQQWIKWTERTIQAAVAENNYFLEIRRQCIRWWAPVLTLRVFVC